MASVNEYHASEYEYEWNVKWIRIRNRMLSVFKRMANEYLSTQNEYQTNTAQPKSTNIKGQTTTWSLSQNTPKHNVKKRVRANSKQMLWIQNEY